jgi:acyl-CoA reductase-like NAD-dependent aldehyde dehydrogenase
MVYIKRKLAPALCCGNVIIIKPSEHAPLSALHVAALIAEAGFPPGVVNVLPGFGETTGAAIALNKDIDKIAFTGSTRVGRLILQAAGKSNCKDVTLELGGKSPVIVLADANLEYAIEAAHHALFFNQGQCCAAGGRTYVQDEIYDEFVRKAVARAKSRVVGDPMMRGVEQGPQINQEQFTKCMDFINQGVEQGAKLACGGRRVGNRGYFLEPTVLTDVDDDNICACEEIFGPVQVILRFHTVEEVVKRANNSRYGLASGVFTSSLDNAMKLSMELRAGSVWVNSYDLFFAQAPFGGYKESGIGNELGSYGLVQYSAIKTVAIKVPAKNT